MKGSGPRSVFHEPLREEVLRGPERVAERPVGVGQRVAHELREFGERLRGRRRLRGARPREEDIEQLHALQVGLAELLQPHPQGARGAHANAQHSVATVY